MHPTFEAPRFGTDGLRGEAGRPPLDRATLRRVGAALGIWLQQRGPATKRVLIGNDGRASAPWIGEALAAGLMASEVVAVDGGLMTTPALAFLTRSGPFVAGVMISASHNPAHDNGVKIFADDGHKLADDDERELERLIAEIDLDQAAPPRWRQQPDLVARYHEFLGNAFPGLDLGGARVVVDGANGGGSALAPTALRLFGAEVVAMCCNPDGNNINADCGALHPKRLAAAVREHDAVLGVALDGDGDRGIFVDDRGQVRDGDDVLAALAPALQQRGALPGDAIAATVMSNLGLRKTLAAHGIAVHTTAVGDRAVVAKMRELGLALGGEQSGHIIFAEGADYTGDGLFTALSLLALPGVLRHGSAGAFTEFRRYPQRLVNVPVRSKPPLTDLPAITAAVQRAEAELAGDGRVVLRYSGTENLCRVMVEGADDAAVSRLTEDIAETVRRALQ